MKHLELTQHAQSDLAALTKAIGMTTPNLDYMDNGSSVKIFVGEYGKVYLSLIYSINDKGMIDIYIQVQSIHGGKSHLEDKIASPSNAGYLQWAINHYLTHLGKLAFGG